MQKISGFRDLIRPAGITVTELARSLRLGGSRNKKSDKTNTGSQSFNNTRDVIELDSRNSKDNNIFLHEIADSDDDCTIIGVTNVNETSSVDKTPILEFGDCVIVTHITNSKKVPTNERTAFVASFLPDKVKKENVSSDHCYYDHDFVNIFDAASKKGCFLENVWEKKRYSLIEKLRKRTRLQIEHVEALAQLRPSVFLSCVEHFLRDNNPFLPPKNFGIYENIVNNINAKAARRQRAEKMIVRTYSKILPSQTVMLRIPGSQSAIFAHCNSRLGKVLNFKLCFRCLH